MRPVPSTITDPAATRFLSNRDPGDETTHNNEDRILLDESEYRRRLQLAYEEGFEAGKEEVRLRARTVAYRLLATLEA